PRRPPELVARDLPRERLGPVPRERPRAAVSRTTAHSARRSESSIHFFSAASTSRQKRRTDSYSSRSTRDGSSANERVTSSFPPPIARNVSEYAAKRSLRRGLWGSASTS